MNSDRKKESLSREEQYRKYQKRFDSLQFFEVLIGMMMIFVTAVWGKTTFCEVAMIVGFSAEALLLSFSFATLVKKNRIEKERKKAEAEKKE